MSTLGERSEVAAVARQTLERGLEHLLSLQHADGYWWGELESNATITSEFWLDVAIVAGFMAVGLALGAATLRRRTA